MGDERFDVIVIGGGPAGATLATLLARRNSRVGLFERERFPRFHIGESLLPCAMPLFQELGILPELERRFLPKYAAEFVTEDGTMRRRYSFEGGLVRGYDRAFEVDRAEFDRLLLDNAARSGALVHEGVQVTDFELGANSVSVKTRDHEGREGRAEAELLVDASGQSSLLAGRLGKRRMDPALKNFSVFSHFEGAERYSGKREGDISVVLSPDGWWWRWC